MELEGFVHHLKDWKGRRGALGKFFNLSFHLCKVRMIIAATSDVCCED